MKYASVAAAALLASIHVALPRAAATGAAEFGETLARAYQALADVEKAQGDHRDADAYAARAASARAGSPPDPDRVELRAVFLKADLVGELSGARERLMSAFGQGGRDKAPAAAARAQSAFDCWLEQAEEDLQAEHVDACKQAFLMAAAEVEKALIPPPAPQPVADPDSDGDGVPDSRDSCPDTPRGTPVDARGCPQIPDLRGVHFEHDKARLTSEARAVLDEGVSIVERNPHVRIEIVGHTDASGSEAYNQRLSERRADAVKSYFVEQGLASSRIAASGRGESEPIADNGTRAGRAENRRVAITAHPR